MTCHAQLYHSLDKKSRCGPWRRLPERNIHVGVHCEAFFIYKSTSRWRDVAVREETVTEK